MKLTVTQLRRIIKEEVARVFQGTEYKEEPVNEGLFKSLVSSVAKIGMSEKAKKLFDEIVELQEAGANKNATKEEKAKVIRRLEDIKKAVLLAAQEKNPGKNDLTQSDITRLKSLATGALENLNA